MNEVHLRGQIKTQPWTYSAFIDKEGNARSTNEVTAHRVLFLGGSNGQDEPETADQTVVPSDLTRF